MMDFSSFYLDLHPRLVSTLVGVSGDVDLAADSADEACARALQRWRRVSAMSNPQGWVYRVALNELRRRLRRRSVEQRLLRLRSPEPALAKGPAGEMWQLVAELPDRQREAVALRYLGQLTEPEIAAVMEITRGTVSSTLRAAHDRLRRSIDTPLAEGTRS